MKGLDTIARVRQKHFGRHRSIKVICRELHVSRNMVRKILRSEATEFQYTREVQPFPRIGPWQQDLDRLLLANEGKARASGGAARMPGRHRRLQASSVGLLQTPLFRLPRLGRGSVSSLLARCRRLLNRGKPTGHAGQAGRFPGRSGRLVIAIIAF